MDKAEINQKGLGDDITIADMSTRTPTKMVLAENLNRLMATTWALKSNPKLAHRSGLGLGTIGRVRNAEVAVNLDTLDSLAMCFGVRPWEMLIPQQEQARHATPEVAPANPAVQVAAPQPAPLDMTSTAQELASLFDMLTDRVERMTAFNAATEAILRILSERAAAPLPAPAPSAEHEATGQAKK